MDRQQRLPVHSPLMIFPRRRFLKKPQVGGVFGPYARLDTVRYVYTGVYKLLRYFTIILKRTTCTAERGRAQYRWQEIDTCGGVSCTPQVVLRHDAPGRPAGPDARACFENKSIRFTIKICREGVTLKRRLEESLSEGIDQTTGAVCDWVGPRTGGLSRQSANLRSPSAISEKWVISTQVRDPSSMFSQSYFHSAHQFEVETVVQFRYTGCTI